MTVGRKGPKKIFIGFEKGPQALSRFQTKDLRVLMEKTLVTLRALAAWPLDDQFRVSIVCMFSVFLSTAAWVVNLAHFGSTSHETRVVTIVGLLQNVMSNLPHVVALTFLLKGAQELKTVHDGVLKVHDRLSAIGEFVVYDFKFIMAYHGIILTVGLGNLIFEVLRDLDDMTLQIFSYKLSFPLALLLLHGYSTFFHVVLDASKSQFRQMTDSLVKPLSIPQLEIMTEIHADLCELLAVLESAHGVSMLFTSSCVFLLAVGNIYSFIESVSVKFTLFFFLSHTFWTVLCVHQQWYLVYSCVANEDQVFN
jgi:hypothetical protein